MHSAKLVQKIENAGGVFRIEGRSVELLWPDFEQQVDLWPDGRPDLRQEAFRRLVVELQEPGVAYLLQAWLLEKQAEQKWEEFSHWPHWWRE